MSNLADGTPKKFDMESDVVIVGYGGAGAVAAITAHDLGARVLILEKTSAGGGNTKLSGGTFLTPTGMGGVPYIEKISYGTMERDIAAAFLETALKNESYMRSLGGEPEISPDFSVGYPSPSGKASFPHVPGAEFMSKRVLKRVKGTRGERLWEVLATNVERRGVPVLLDTPVRELLTNGAREVTGVVAERDGKKITVKARKAVVLTTGGFEFDEALKWDFLASKPFYAYGHPGNTGDGIRMAQQVGAALWHMPATSASAGFKCDEYQASFGIRFISERFIYVDKNGQRFTDEAGVELHEIAAKLAVFDSKRMDYPRIPMYAIFDDVARRKAPLNPGGTGINQYLYKWSADNSAEVARGWIAQGRSIRDLAARIGIDPAALEKTVATYNQYCKTGKDPDFERGKETLAAIETSSFYAIKLYPCLINTQGGPRRDKDSHVLDAWGKPIPRLYAAGELGSIWGFMYQGSGNNGESIVFGQIAGRNAAGEKPWG
ncbi:MAG: FAD-binding protein [Chloroflexi bacterium]|nr:FAD-binding protein [Chloroflexota bacterium]